MLYNFVLFLHLFVVLCAFVLIGLLTAVRGLMRGTQTVAELRRFAKLGKLNGLFGPIVLLLFGLGAWLVALSKAPNRFHFSDPFVYTAIATLVLLMAIGLGVEMPHQKRFEAALAAAPEGPVDSALRALALSNTVALASGVSNFLVLGVVFNMVNKPSALGSIGALLIAAAIGAATAAIQARAPHAAN